MWIITITMNCLSFEQLFSCVTSTLLKQSEEKFGTCLKPLYYQTLFLSHIQMVLCKKKTPYVH